MRARLAIVAVYLGDISIVDDMLETNNRPDPVQRTVLIVEIPQWHADSMMPAKVARTTESGPTRSGSLSGLAVFHQGTLAMLPEMRGVTR